MKSQRSKKSKKSDCSLKKDDLRSLRKHLKNPDESNSAYLKECFDMIDTDRSGALDKNEFKVFLDFLLSFPDGFSTANKTHGSTLKDELDKVAKHIDDETYEELFNQVDLNKDQNISFDEFRAFLCLTEEEKLFMIGVETDVIQNMSLQSKDEKTQYLQKIRESKNKISLELTSVGLITIPKELMALDQLERLDLAFNKFVSWPTELNVFHSLKELTLTANKISVLGDMSGLHSLDTLYMIGNKLTSLGSEIFKLKSLTKLDLSNNEIREISPAIALLDELRELNLCGNLIENLPVELGMMGDLNALDLNGNLIKEFPPEVCKMKRMMELDLSNNRLTKLPEEFGKMDRLVFVSICDNKIEKIPNSIGKCKFIDKFLMDRNPIRDEEMMKKYNLSMDHWKDLMEKRAFMDQQDGKKQAKEDLYKAQKQQHRDKKAEKQEDAQQQQQQKERETQKKVVVVEAKPTSSPVPVVTKVDPVQQEVMKSGLTVKKELAEISRSLFKATDISQVVTIAKAIRDANVSADLIRPELSSAYPKQTMNSLDPSLDQFTRLKHTTTFAVMQLDSFFKQLSIKSADLQTCAKSSTLSASILNILKILKSCTDTLRNALMKAESKRLTSVTKK